MLALGDKGRVSSFGISIFIMLGVLSFERLAAVAVEKCASSGEKCGMMVAG